MNDTKPELIIFDCDGVLVDTEQYFTVVFRDHLLPFGLELDQIEFNHRFTGKRFKEVLQELSVSQEIYCSHDIEDTVTLLREKLDQEVLQKNIEEMPNALAVIKPLPFKKCIASNASVAFLERVLKKTTLWDMFDPFIFSADQVARAKPHPDLFLYAAEKMGTDPSRCLVIEDSITGMTAAKKANMRVWAFLGGSHSKQENHTLLQSAGAEKIIRDMLQLKEEIDLLSLNCS